MGNQKYYICDCVEGCKKYIADKSVKMVFADPPFNIELGKSGAYSKGVSTNKEIYYEDNKTDDEYASWASTWIEQAYRVLVDDGIFVLMSSWNYVGVLEAVAKKIGFKTLNHVIWKYKFGVYATRRYTTAHYHYLILLKGDPRKGDWTFNSEGKYQEDVYDNIDLILDELTPEQKEMNVQRLARLLMDIIYDKAGEYGVPDLFEDLHRLSGEMYKDVYHPCKLSEYVLMRFFELFSNKDDLVVDLFMGSGTSLVAAYALDRKYIGFEINGKYNPEIKKLINRRIPIVKSMKKIDTLI